MRAKSASLHERGLGGVELGARLARGRLGGRDLRVEGFERGLLRRELGCGLIDGELVVAVVEADERVAGLHVLVLDDRHLGDVGRDLGRDDRHVGADIGVVGRDDEAADGHVVVAVPAGGDEGGDAGRSEQEALARRPLAGGFRVGRARPSSAAALLDGLRPGDGAERAEAQSAARN